jgi:hypothetical protein
MLSLSRFTSRFTRRENRSAVAFFSIVVVGLGLSIGLTLHSAFDKAPLVVSKANHHRNGLTDIVTVTVRNRSGTVTYCPEVSISALNRNDTDIEQEIAKPVEGGGRIVPGDIEGFTAQFTKITPKDYRENLSGFQGFVIKKNPCGGS